MDTKTKQAVDHWKSDRLIESLRIFKTFKIGIKPSDRRKIEMGYEIMNGKDKFYRQIGINIEAMLYDVVVIIEKFISDYEKK